MVVATVLILFTLLVWARWNAAELPLKRCTEQYHRACFVDEHGAPQPVHFP